ncbi:MAG TPA: hypothetical protein VIY29_19420, partial [Ktedonobacteraceae bacterium]
MRRLLLIHFIAVVEHTHTSSGADPRQETLGHIQTKRRLRMFRTLSQTAIDGGMNSVLPHLNRH